MANLRAKYFSSFASKLLGSGCPDFSRSFLAIQKRDILAFGRCGLSSPLRCYGNDGGVEKPSVAGAMHRRARRSPCEFTDRETSWLRGRKPWDAMIWGRHFSATTAVASPEEGKVGGPAGSWTATPAGGIGPALSECASAGAAIRWWSAALLQRGVPEAEVSAEYLVAHVLGHKQLSELTNRVLEGPLSQSQLDLINTLCARRNERVPVQYIVGDWDFRDETFILRPPVFIPSPETEMLIDIVVPSYQEGGRLHFLEIGCGSGVISISLLKEMPQLHMTAIDASEEAVQLTTENAKRLGVLDRLTLHHAAMASDLPPCLQGRQSPFDAVVSNPPYLSSEDVERLVPEIKLYEDLGAVHGGVDGLALVKALLQNARHLVVPGGSIWLETDIRHPGQIRAWLTDNPGTGVKYLQSFLDYTDRPRFSRLEFQA